MIGDMSDMAARLAQLLPTGWFADEAPNLAALLNGLGQGWANIYALLQQARALSLIHI